MNATPLLPGFSSNHAQPKRERGGVAAPAHGSAWREVSQEEFYRVIGPQNVHPSPQGDWPYTSLWKTPSGDIKGKTVGYLTSESGLEKKQYLLPNALHHPAGADAEPNQTAPTGLGA